VKKAAHWVAFFVRGLTDIRVWPIDQTSEKCSLFVPCQSALTRFSVLAYFSTKTTEGQTESWAALEGAVMIKENWRIIVLTLLLANLVFMALLDLQRRTTTDREREFTARIEQILLYGDASKTRVTQVSEIEKRTKDTYERVIQMQAKLNEIGSGRTPR
jgi:hypothetical protein